MSTFVYILAVLTAFSCLACIALGLIAIAVTANGVDSIDKHLSPLAHKNEPFVKIFPVCAGRMTRYGFIILFWRTGFIQRRVLAGREDRVQAIDSAPPWMRRTVVCIYLGFSLFGAITFTLTVVTATIKNMFL